ncbi:MAG TPA: hypothetical protein VOB72_05800 [Candidatus Dormibacteraeota bacterium]|nr:hypothetical protein [Candidatus Dormibacteraeota bacterium]
MEARDLPRLRDRPGVRFGEPIDRDGVTLVPVHGRFGPRGAYVVAGGEVRWEPALDLNRVIAGGQLIGLAAVLMLGGVLIARAVGRRR